MQYVSLHHHSTYSYMDGFGLPETHVARAAELEMSALALTEHGNVSSHVKLEIAAKKHNIKPLFGIEAYMGPANMRETANRRKWHQTILAMNQVGLNNLYQAVTRSWDEGFYQWPTWSWEILREHSEGLIVLSGCLDSKLACDLLGGKGRDKGDIRDAESTLRAYLRLFGDRFYLECQQFPELERAHKLNAQYEIWSRKYGIPLVATADCHYPFGEDNQMQKILHAAGRNIGSVAAAEASWEYDILLTFPRTDAELRARLQLTGLSRKAADGAIQATAEIAERCNVVLPKMDRVRYPIQDDPAYKPGMTSLDLFRAWMNDGWLYRGFNKLDRKTAREYKERCEYELALFADKDFLDYFLMLSDAVRACKDNQIPVGPARGSAAASLVCYLLRITEVNPMQYPLMLFERFVDPNRMDLPDVDLDFDDDLRDFVRQHLIQKYGKDRVGNIGTFTRYRGKNSIDDVARVYEIPKFEVEKVKELLVTRSGGDARFDASIEDTLEMFPQAKAVFDTYPRLYESLRLEGNLKGFGVHAAGLVVGAQPLHNYVATYTKHGVGENNNTVQVLSVDKYDGEELGLLKLDALGLSTMGMIRQALEIIGMTLDDLYKIPMDEPETLEAFSKADVVGIFQFDGRTMKMTTQEIVPKTFMDLAAINALSRPGPLHSGSTGDYIAIRHGRAKRESLHPIVDLLTETTEGQIIYQEQILQICRDFGKFPWVHAAAIRKIISQKKGEAAFNSLWKDFESGAASQGIDSKTADLVWKRMVTAGTYAFNIAHCVSYSMLGFWCMWLKVHHPEAFYAAQLRKANTDPKVRKDLDIMRDMADDRFRPGDKALKVRPPNLNRSGITWMPEKGGVRAGFSQIPGIGLKVATKIVEMRESLPNGFKEWSDLDMIPGIGPKTILKIQQFCEQSDPFGIDRVKEGAAEIRRAIRRGQLGNVPMPTTLSEDIPYEDKKSFHVIMGTIKQRNLQDFFENHFSRTGEHLDPKTVTDPELKDYMTLYLVDERGPFTVKIDRWKYPKYKDDIWGADPGKDFIIAKVVKKPYFGKTVHIQDMWVVTPD